jgi:hypothetical protein
MPDDASNAEREALIQAYVEGRLSPEESTKLLRLVREDPLLARVIVQSLRTDEAIRELVGVKAVPLAESPAPPGPDADATPSRRPTRRAHFARLLQLRGPGDGPRLALLATAAAAVVLLVLGAVLLGNPRPTGPATVQQPKRPVRPDPAPASRELPEPTPKPVVAIEKRAPVPPPPPPPSPELPPSTLPEDRPGKEEIERAMREELERLRKAVAEATPDRADPRETPKGPDPAPPPAAVPTRTGLATTERPDGEVYVVGEGLRELLGASRELLAGQGLETGAAGGRVVVRFADRTLLELEPGTLIREIRSEKGKWLRIERGSVRAEVTRQPAGMNMVFSTPHGDATVRGTTLRLVVDPDSRKGTLLEVTEGLVELKGKYAGKSVEVPAGHKAVSAAGMDLVATAPPKTLVERLLDENKLLVINFGPDGNELPRGVLNDAGLPFDAARGYGWTRQILAGYWNATKLRTDTLRSTFVYGGSPTLTESWRLRLPNGTYLVQVSVGTYDHDQGPHGVRVQDQLLLDAVMTEKNRFQESRPTPVEIRDGVLEMVIGGRPSARMPSDNSPDTVVNFIVISRRPDLRKK